MMLLLFFLRRKVKRKYVAGLSPATFSFFPATQDMDCYWKDRNGRNPKMQHRREFKSNKISVMLPLLTCSDALFRRQSYALILC